MLTLSRVAALALMPAKAYTATGNDTGVSLQGYMNPGGRAMRAILDVGSQSGTTPTLDVKIQESDNDSTYIDITGAVFTQVGGALSHQEISFRTNKKYIRSVHTIAGGTPNYGVSCQVLVEKTQP